MEKQQSSMKPQQKLPKGSTKDLNKSIIGEMELEETGNWQDPNTKFFTYPRFFIIHSDGRAVELMSGS